MKKYLSGFIVIIILLFLSLMVAESEQELRQRFIQTPTPENLLQLGDKATVADFQKLDLSQQGNYLESKYNEEFAQQYFRSPDSVGRNSNVDLKYFSNRENVGKNPESDRKFFSGSYVANSEQKSRENFRAAKESGSVYLTKVHGANYVIESVDEDFVYDENEGTLTNGRKTISFALFENKENIKRIRTVEGGIFIEEIYEKQTRFVGEGELKVTNYDSDKGTYILQQGTSEHTIARMDKEDVEINSNSEGGISITGKVIGSSVIGKSRYIYDNYAGTLNIKRNGEFSADNAKLITPTLFVEGRFSSSLTQKNKLDLSLYSYDGKQSLVVDKTSLLGVTSQGQSRENGEKVIVHLGQKNGQSIYSPSSSPRLGSGEKNEVWLSQEGANLNIYAKGKVKVNGYLDSVRTIGTAILNPQSINFQGKNELASFDYYSKAGWDQFQMKGQGVYEDPHFKSDLVQDGAIVNKLPPTQTPSKKDLLSVTCPSCKDNENIGILTKKLTAINGEVQTYDVPVVDPRTGLTTTKTVEVLSPNGETKDLPITLHKKQGQIVPLIDQRQAGALASNFGPEGGLVSERNLLLVGSEGTSQTYFGILDNGIGSFELNPQGQVQNKKVAFNLNLRTLSGESLIIDPSQREKTQQFLELLSQGKLTELGKLNSADFDENTRKTLLEQTGIDVKGVSNPKYLEGIQRSTEIQDQKVGTQLKTIEKNFGLTLDSSGRCISPSNCNDKLQKSLSSGDSLAQYYLSLLSTAAESKIALLEGEQALGEDKSKDVQELKSKVKQLKQQKDAWNNAYTRVLDQKQKQKEIILTQATAQEELQSYAEPFFGESQQQSLTEAAEIGVENEQLMNQVKKMDNAVAELQQKREAEIKKTLTELNTCYSEFCGNTIYGYDDAAKEVDSKKVNYASKIAQAKAEKIAAEGKLVANRRYVEFLTTVEDNPATNAEIYRQSGDYQSSTLLNKQMLSAVEENNQKGGEIDTTPIRNRLYLGYVQSGDYASAREVAQTIDSSTQEEVEGYIKQKQIAAVTEGVLIPAINQQAKETRENLREKEDQLSSGYWGAEFVMGPISFINKAVYIADNNRERTISQMNLQRQVDDANGVVQQVSAGVDPSKIQTQFYKNKANIALKTAQGQQLTTEEEASARLEELKNQESLGLRRNRARLEDQYAALGKQYTETSAGKEAQERSEEVNSWDLQDTSTSGALAGDIVTAVAGGVGVGVYKTAVVTAAATGKEVGLATKVVGKVSRALDLMNSFDPISGVQRWREFSAARKLLGEGAEAAEKSILKSGDSALADSATPASHNINMMDRDNYEEMGEYYLRQNSLESEVVDVPSAATAQDYAQDLVKNPEGSLDELYNPQLADQADQVPLESATFEDYAQNLVKKTDDSLDTPYIAPSSLESQADELTPLVEATPEEYEAALKAIPEPEEALRTEIRSIKNNPHLTPTQKAEQLDAIRKSLDSSEVKAEIPEPALIELKAEVEPKLADEVQKNLEDTPVEVPAEVSEEVYKVKLSPKKVAAIEAKAKAKIAATAAKDTEKMSAKATVEEVTKKINPLQKVWNAIKKAVGKETEEASATTVKTAEEVSEAAAKAPKLDEVSEIAPITSRRERLLQQFKSQPFDEDATVKILVENMNGKSGLDNKALNKLLTESPETIERVKIKVKSGLIEKGNSDKIDLFEGLFSVQSNLHPGYRPVFEIENTIKTKELTLNPTEKELQSLLLKRGENLFAQGVEEEKGGITNLINIQLEGEVRYGYEGTLSSGDPTFFAGSHGPYYVVFEKKASTFVDNGIFHPDSEIAAFIVPGERHRKVITDALDEAVKKGMISVEEQSSILKRVITYNEMNKLPDSALADGISLREAMNSNADLAAAKAQAGVGTETLDEVTDVIVKDPIIKNSEPDMLEKGLINDETIRLNPISAPSTVKAQDYDLEKILAEWEDLGSLDSSGVISTHPIRMYGNPATGERVLVKGGPAHTTEAEFIGQRIFEEAGLPVPKTSLGVKDGELVQVMNFVENGKSYQVMPAAFHSNPTVQKGFAIDTLVYNYDRADWNLLYLDNGGVVFIDEGAAGLSRAQGGFKGFQSTVDVEQIKDVLSNPQYLGKEINPAYKQVVEVVDGKLVIKERKVIEDSIATLRGISDQRIDEIVDEAYRFTAKQDRIATLNERLAKLKESVQYNPNSRTIAAIETTERIITEFGGDEAAYYKFALKGRRDSLADLLQSSLDEVNPVSTTPRVLRQTDELYLLGEKQRVFYDSKERAFLKITDDGNLLPNQGFTLEEIVGLHSARMDVSPEVVRDAISDSTESYFKAATKNEELAVKVFDPAGVGDLKFTTVSEYERRILGFASEVDYSSIDTKEKILELVILRARTEGMTEEKIGDIIYGFNKLYQKSVEMTKNVADFSEALSKLDPTFTDVHFLRDGNVLGISDVIAKRMTGQEGKVKLSFISRDNSIAPGVLENRLANGWHIGMSKAMAESEKVKPLITDAISHTDSEIEFKRSFFKSYAALAKNDPQFKQVALRYIHIFNGDGVLKPGAKLRFIDTCCAGSLNYMAEGAVNLYSTSREFFEEANKLIGVSRSFDEWRGSLETSSFMMHGPKYANANIGGSEVETTAKAVNSAFAFAENGQPIMLKNTNRVAKIAVDDMAGEYSAYGEGANAVVAFLDELIVAKNTFEKFGAAQGALAAVK